MSNIIEFPYKTLSEWDTLEKKVRNVLNDAGAPTEMQESICRTMKNFFNKYSIELEFSISLPLLSGVSEEALTSAQHEINKGTTELSKRVQTFTTEVFLDRLLLEIELYGLKNRS